MSDTPKQQISIAVSHVTDAKSRLEAALAYAGAGLLVFPVYEIEAGKCSCGKSDCQHPGKHPRTANGLKNATTDSNTIHRWWKLWPVANIAIVTGPNSGVWVLDNDPGKGGSQSLQELFARHHLPQTLTNKTGGGGDHFVFQWLDGIKSRNGFRPGLDVKGEGGYVIVPPSNHISGGTYQWANHEEPAEPPPWLIDLVTRSKQTAVNHQQPVEVVPAHPDDMAQLLSRADAYVSAWPPEAEGNRDNVAFRLAGHLAALDQHGLRLSEAQITEFVVAWNSRCDPPLPEPVIRNKVSSALRNGTPRALKPVQAGDSQKRNDIRTTGLVLTCLADVEAKKVSWPEIEPLDSVALPDFPVDALPDDLRQWVQEESHATQTPPDLASLLALAVISATIAKRVEVEARPGWREPVNLFVAVLLEPGNRKSAVFTDAIKPLREIETELIEAARGEIAILQSQRRQKEKQLKRLEEQAAKGGSDSAPAAHEALQLAEELAREDEPVLPRRIADDATAEKLGIILAQQGGRIASLSPEGGVFDLMAGQYSKSGIPQFNVYLMGHSGDDILTDRVSRQSVSVKRPALTCGYAIQPAVIEGIAKNAAFRGRGLLARFLYAAPRSWIGHRQIAPRPMALATANAYRDVVRTLSALEGEAVLSLTDDAEMRLEKWEEEIERTLADGGDMEMIRDWGSKLAGATLRLAAAFHCVKNCGAVGQIDDETLTSAIRIASFLIPHAEHVLTLMDLAKESADGDAHYVLKWIKENQLREFTKRDAHQHGRRRFPKADDIDPALALLADRGYIRLKPVDSDILNKAGRPPSPRYEVNPVVFENQNSKDRTQNPHKSNSALPYNLSEDSEDRFFKAEDQNRERFTI